MTFPRLTHALLQGKPYFGSALRALQGDPSRHQYFEPAVRRAAALTRGKPVDILEVGSWAGASAVTWARALQAVGCGGRVVCIDTWAPYFDTDADAASHYQDMDEAARRGEIYRLFLHNIEACGVADIVSHHIADSRKMESLFEPGSFSIVYIDGNHALDFVRSDIKAAKALTSANGIVCGDDLELSLDQVDAAAHGAEVKLGVDLI
ncbi:MAG: class I SAM-dependent methyltransferase, partial [Terricaulis sp.]